MILCCGESLIDMIPSVSADGKSGFVPHAGGSVFNTAIALGRLGNDIGFVTGLSRDLFGVQLVETLNNSHVDSSLAIQSDLPTTLAFVELNDGQARYTFYDENTAGRSLMPDQLPAVPDKVEALYFGGISLISEPCAEFYAAFSLREASDRVIVMDPNIRAAFVKDEVGYRARLDKMIAVADIVKVSDEDLDWIIPGSIDLEAKARVFCDKGPQIVIVTRGGDGAQAFFDNGAQVAAPAQRVDLVDTVGAGDTFNAGVLSHLIDKGLLTKARLSDIDTETMEAALHHGAAVAAVTVSRAGANPPWAHELP